MHILLYEADDNLRDLLVNELAHSGHTVTATNTFEIAIKFLRTVRFDVVIAEVVEKTCTPNNLYARLRAHASGSPIIVYTTGHWLEDVIPEDAIFLQKTHDYELLLAKIEELHNSVIVCKCA